MKGCVAERHSVVTYREKRPCIRAKTPPSPCCFAWASRPPIEPLRPIRRIRPIPNLPKPRRLPCAFQHRLPEFAVGVDLPATMRRERDRKMDEGAVPAAYEEVGLSSHAGVHGGL